MPLYTIGFTQKRARRFFSLLTGAGVRKLFDTRLNNRSQLAGFAKGEDLRYFLEVIGGIEYEHVLEMAPTDSLLSAYKKEGGAWIDYERAFYELIEGRQLVERYSASSLEGTCLLCSEHEPEHCHRRLVAEYFQRRYPELRVIHLI